MSNLITAKRKLRNLEARVSLLESNQVSTEGSLEDVVEDVNTINVELEASENYTISAYDIVTQQVGAGNETSTDVLITIDRSINQEIITLSAIDTSNISSGITFDDNILQPEQTQTVMHLGTLTGSGAYNITINGITPLGVEATTTFIVNLPI